jgi:hypothetical protein
MRIGILGSGLMRGKLGTIATGSGQMAENTENDDGSQ